MSLLSTLSQFSGRRAFARTFCGTQQAPHKDLTSLRRVFLPNVIYTVYNSTVGRLKLNSLVDPKFRWMRFMEGATQAIFLVSGKVSDENFDEMSGLVLPKTVAEIRENLKFWSPSERKNIRVQDTDVLFYAPYNTELRKDDDRYRLEVNVLVQYVPGLEQEIAAMPFDSFTEKAYVANYSFLRFYKDRKALGSWIISSLNHFSHKDELDRKTGRA